MINLNKDKIQTINKEIKKISEVVQQFKGRSTNQNVEKVIAQKNKEFLLLKSKVDALKSEIKTKTKEMVEVRTRVNTRQTVKSDLEVNWNDFHREQEIKAKKEKHLKDKLREALKIQETYKRILERLREERSQFDAHLKNMQKSYESKTNDSREVHTIKNESHDAKRQAIMDIKFLKRENDKKNEQLMKNIDKERILQNKKAKVLNVLEERKLDDYKQD